LKQQISFLDKWIQKEIKKNNPKKVHKAGGWQSFNQNNKLF
jgi:hypothetical protein